MSKYIDNVNTYLNETKIKKSYVSLMTEIDPSKLTRLLSKSQEIVATDMEKIATAFGKNVEFFMAEDFENLIKKERMKTEVAFYAGNPGEEQERFASKLIELVDNIDHILGARGRYTMSIGEE